MKYPASSTGAAAPQDCNYKDNNIFMIIIMIMIIILMIIIMITMVSNDKFS